MSDCGVCLTGCEDADTDFVHSKVSVARKLHVCCECGKEIIKGDKYERSSGRTDGDFWSFSTCLICAEIATAFYCTGRWYGGILWEEMREYAFGEMTTGCLERLATAAAKAELMKRWNEWKFVQP
jgi:hypothetical protein